MNRINGPGPAGKKARLRAARAYAENRELHVPARKVIVRSPVRILRELASMKMRCKVPCESAIEYDYYVLLDTRPDVVAFYAQPELFQYVDGDGIVRRYFPDVEVHFTSGHIEIQEVKTDKDADAPDMQRKHAAIAAEYANQGVSYRVVRESEIRREPRLSNAMLLRSVRMRRPVRTVMDQVHEALATRMHTVAELQAVIGRGAEGGADLLVLALRNLVRLDWDTVPIGPGCPVFLPAEVGDQP